MVPWFIVLMVQMWLVHSYALSLPGYGFKDSAAKKHQPVAVVAMAAVAKYS
jgi:uncharacterized membrane protein YadS